MIFFKIRRCQFQRKMRFKLTEIFFQHKFYIFFWYGCIEKCKVNYYYIRNSTYSIIWFICDLWSMEGTILYKSGHVTLFAIFTLIYFPFTTSRYMQRYSGICGTDVIFNFSRFLKNKNQPGRDGWNLANDDILLFKWVLLALLFRNFPVRQFTGMLALLHLRSARI